MSGIVINIKAGATKEQSSVTVTGQQVHIIADSERAGFGIGSDADLKQAIGRFFGKEPNDAYLHSPTPWNDLYKTYKWGEVKTVLEPKKAEILDVSTRPTILFTDPLINESDITATCTASISEQVTNTVSNTWSQSSKFSAEQTIKVEVQLLGAKLGSETKIGFEQTWGKAGTVTKQSSVGMSTGVSVELKPRESAIVELSASSGTMRVRITYEAHLIGQTAVNYNPRYKGHHFWGLSIDDVIAEPKKVEIVEDIEVGFYSNATVKVKNAKTNEKMMFFVADHSDHDPSADHPDGPPSADHPSEPPSE